MTIAGTSDPAAPGRPGLARRLALVLATAGGAGYAPVAPGTFGSAVGVVLFWPLAALGLAGVLLAAAALLAAGIWAADETERHYGRKDDGRIVIDEVVGQLLTLAPLPLFGAAHSLPWLVTGFVAFRVLDIWKPGPARWMERRLPGGAGVMMDDVVAGLFGGVLMAGLLWGLS